MKQKLKSKIIKKDVIDLKGYTIRKGTKIFIVKEFDLVHFRTHEKEHFTKCLIDNGTGIKSINSELEYLSYNSYLNNVRKSVWNPSHKDG